MTEVTILSGVGRVFDPVRRPLGRWLFSSTSENRNLALPKPPIFCFALGQPGPHGIVTGIVDLVDKAVVRPKYMIKEFFLPDRAAGFAGNVNLASGAAFDGLPDLGEGLAPASLAAARKDELNMVRNDDRSMQIEHAAVFFQAALENDVSSSRRELPAAICGEGDK